MVRDQECQWALTQKQTLRGGGALQVCDLCLAEDGGECSGTLLSDPVLRETAERGMERVRTSVSTGIDTKANTRAAAHPRLVICVSLRMAASAEAPLAPMLLFMRLQVRGGAEMVKE